MRSQARRKTRTRTLLRTCARMRIQQQPAVAIQVKRKPTIIYLLKGPLKLRKRDFLHHRLYILLLINGLVLDQYRSLKSETVGNYIELEGKIYQNNFQEHDFLRDLKIPPCLTCYLLRSSGKRVGNSNSVKNRVLESCSNIFFPLEHFRRPRSCYRKNLIQFFVSFPYGVKKLESRKVGNNILEINYKVS